MVHCNSPSLRTNAATINDAAINAVANTTSDKYNK